MRLRIPLIRFAGDDAPTAKWEAWFYPIVIPVVFLAMLVSFAAWVILGPPIYFMTSAIAKSRIRKLRVRMKEAGRYLPESELRKHLDDHRGTLIAVYTSGTLYWWTGDDIVSEAPVTLPTTFDEPQTRQMTSFADECLQKYTNPSTGIALLTEKPELGGPNQASIITIRDWGETAEIVSGLVLRSY